MERASVYTPSEAAAVLKVPLQTVWRWCRNGTIPAVKFGRTWRIQRAALDAKLGRVTGAEHDEQDAGYRAT